MSIAIVTASGAFRCAFVHGVLASFEQAGFYGDGYASASSSVIPTAYASLGQIGQLGGAAYWKKGLEIYRGEKFDVSQMILQGIEEHGPALREGLFAKGARPFLVATSAVISQEAAELTQGRGARRLGQKLLLARRGTDKSWADEHFRCHLFGTMEGGGILPLTASNMEEVIYASTRMLHAWKIPAAINGRPYVDASYTCSCPAVEMAKLGYDQVIAIVPETGPVYRDIFLSRTIPPMWREVPIHFIQPARPLNELGVDYLTASSSGFDAVYELGRVAGTEFLEAFEMIG